MFQTKSITIRSEKFNKQETGNPTPSKIKTIILLMSNSDKLKNIPIVLKNSNFREI